MYNKFLWAALGTAALSLGFAACDDDDDNATIDDGYSETYTLHFGGMGDDASEAVKAYYAATGLADDCEEETVTVSGKDSAACNKTFRAIMTKAEDALNSKTDWEDAVSIVAHDSRDSLIYRKVYGDNGNNATEYARVEPLQNINGKAIAVSNTMYIKDYYVDSWSSCSGCNWYGSDKYFTYPDVNDCAGGRYVYISAEPTDNIEEAITGAFVLCCQMPDTVPHELTYNGVIYTCSSELDGETQPNYRNRDLNEKASGRWLYLYTTHDPSLGKALLWGDYTCRCQTLVLSSNGFADKPLSFFTKESGRVTCVGDIVEYLPGSVCCYSLDDLKNIKLRYRDVDYNMEWGQELNENAGGSYYYLIQQWKKHTFATSGSYENKYGQAVDWVQLWAGGPRFAKHNLGASEETELGSFLYWAGGGQINLSSYTSVLLDNIRGYRDYDNATAAWGPRWVTPSKEQMQALIDNTDCEYTTIDGVAGLKCTGRGEYSDNYIFLPGSNSWSVPTGQEATFGFNTLWTSTASSDSQAYMFSFSADDSGTPSVSAFDKNVACTVRPILQ